MTLLTLASGCWQRHGYGLEGGNLKPPPSIHALEPPTKEQDLILQHLKAGEYSDFPYLPESFTIAKGSQVLRSYGNP